VVSVKDLIPEGPPKGMGRGMGSSGNHVFFYEDVDQETISNLNQELRDTATNLLRIFTEWEDLKPPPIHLHIHSDGGDLMAGVAAAETIRLLRVPVHTHIEGGAASAATIMSIAGAHRTITRRSYMLIHQISSDFWGKHEDLKDHKENMDRFMTMIYDIYADRTKLSKARLKEMLKRNIYFTSAEALEYGLVDEVI